MEAVDQLASAGTFRVVKEPLAFLRVLEWGKLVKHGQNAELKGREARNTKERERACLKVLAKQLFVPPI